MNYIKIVILALLIILFIFSCKRNKSENIIEKKCNDQEYKLEKVIKHSSQWIASFDLDGDEKNDSIDFEFTGGGHCCYKIYITLTSDNIERKYPFLMDGGYVFGIPDNSQTDHFNIKDYDNDGLPEIFMEIDTYNGIPNESYPIEWTKKYGIKTNYIIFDYQDNNIIVKDFKLLDK